MFWEHIRRGRDAEQVPAVLLCLCIKLELRGRPRVEKAISFRRDNALHTLLQLGLKLIPNEPSAECSGAGPIGGLPFGAPLFAVDALLRAGFVCGDDVAN